MPYARITESKEGFSEPDAKGDGLPDVPVKRRLQSPPPPHEDHGENRNDESKDQAQLPHNWRQQIASAVKRVFENPEYFNVFSSFYF